jgi:hypothetical protein
MIDVRAMPGIGYVVTNGGKSFFPTSSASVTVTFGVFGRVSGANSVQHFGDWDGENDGNDKHNDDSIDIVCGNFKSVGTLLGNLSANGAGQDIGYNPKTVPFTNMGSQNGIANDFDSDGDLDIGTDGTDLTKMWVVRAGIQAYATEFDGDPSKRGWSKDDSGLSGLNASDVIIDPTTSELQLGSLRFVTSGAEALAGKTALINYVPRLTENAGQYPALWFEDNNPVVQTPDTAPFSLGAPVMAVPEPGSAAALVVLYGIGFVSQRRRGRHGHPIGRDSHAEGEAI